MTIKRYDFLDGMRGIAAILVLTRHTSDFWHFTFFHSYLAVDLFFILSGFVIANSYDKAIKTGQLGPKKFLIVRLVRLYPMFLISVIACAAVGITRIYLDQAKYTEIDLLKTLILTSLFIPARTLGETGLFSINGPYWSLFYELVTNLIYGIIRRKITDYTLICCPIFFGIVLATAGTIHGNLDIGFSWKIGSVAAGFSRAMFGFTFGLVLFRNKETIREYLPKISPWLSLGIATTILVMPTFGRIDIFIDLLSVLLIFPLVICSSLIEPNDTHRKILSKLGTASYPIYVLHLPAGQLLEIFLKEKVENLAPLSGIAFIMLIYIVSIMLDKHIDSPIRNYLKMKLLR